MYTTYQVTDFTRMNYTVHLIGLLLLFRAIEVSANTMCLSCQDVTEPMDCDTVIRCGIHEQCYVDVFVTTAGGARYDLGCRDSFQCKAGAGNIRRRRSTDMMICSHCCYGNLCNSAGCGNTGYPTARGPICYNCPMQLDPEDCSKITICGQDEVCLLQKVINTVSHKVKYQTKCEIDRICYNELQKYKQLVPSLFGRRSRDIHGGTCGLQCCNTDLCNNNCNSSGTADVSTTPLHIPTSPLRATSSLMKPTQLVTTTTTPSLPAPSVSMTRASAEAVTISPGANAHSSTQVIMSSNVSCHDRLSETDCRILNNYLTLCKERVAALAHCAKYCGFC